MTPIDNVYNFISSQLTQGKLKRSDHITEQLLANNLGLSRTPVREALLQLAADDILEREPRKGFKIKTYSKTDVESLYSLIGLLDGKISELTINTIGQEDYALMSFLIDSMYSAIENKLYTKYNDLQEQFHNVYIKESPNLLLKETLQDKKKIFIGKAYVRMKPDTIQKLLRITNKEHETILQLFKEKKTQELRDFIENVHWNPKNAKYDIW